MLKIVKKLKLISGKKGFTLLEVMVAIFIIVTGLTTILILLRQSITGAERSANKLLAANLAQEGIEVIKNIRDLNYDGTNPTGVWSTWYSNVSSGNYLVQYNDGNLRPFSDTYLNYNAATGLYSYDAGNPSIFKRQITLTKLSNVQIKVVSQVTWAEHGQTLSVMAEDRLWNWR